jgi:hypothetical protein
VWVLADTRGLIDRWESHKLLVKCISSDFFRLNVIPLARPHSSISYRSLYSFSQFIYRSIEIASRPMSSTYLNLLARVPS